MEAIGVIVVGILLVLSFSGLFFVRSREAKENIEKKAMEEDFYLTQMEFNSKLAESLESTTNIRDGK